MLDRSNFHSTSDSRSLFENERSAEAIQTEIASIDDPSLRLANVIAAGGDDRKAEDIILLDVEDVSYLADYFIVMTGFSKTQVRAIARVAQDKAEEVCGRSPIHVEGMNEGAWVLLDYGDVIAHVFTPQEREYYSLEAFWGHAKQMPLFTNPALQDSTD